MDSATLDDLKQHGAIGLMEAARSFDPARGAKFWTHARYRVVGAVLDYIRTIYGRHNQKIRPMREADFDDEDATPMALVTGDAGMPEIGALARVRSAAFERLRQLLPVRTAKMAIAHVFDRWQMWRVGEAFGMTESRVCQILTAPLRERVVAIVEQEVAREVSA